MQHLLEAPRVSIFNRKINFIVSGWMKVSKEKKKESIYTAIENLINVHSTPLKAKLN
jgi:hypothetical protein